MQEKGQDWEEKRAAISCQYLPEKGKNGEEVRGCYELALDARKINKWGYGSGPSCRICIFLYQSVHWGFGVGGLGFWGFGDGRKVKGGLGSWWSRVKRSRMDRTSLKGWEIP